MGTIVITEFVSLDGPGGIEAFKLAYEVFAPSWPSPSGAFADGFNSLPKCVVCLEVG